MKTYKHLRKHASKRMRHRFVNIDFNDNIYADAVRCIIKQEPVNQCVPVQFIEKQSNTRAIWLLSIKGQECVAIYDTKRKAINTFMPTEWVISEQNLIKKREGELESCGF